MSVLRQSNRWAWQCLPATGGISRCQAQPGIGTPTRCGACVALESVDRIASLVTTVPLIVREYFSSAEWAGLTFEDRRAACDFFSTEKHNTIQILRCRYCRVPIPYRYRRSRCCSNCKPHHKNLQRSAHAETRYLIAHGFLPGPETGCRACGGTEYPVQCHHLDYRKPRLIEWLCPSCHTQRHEAPHG